MNHGPQPTLPREDMLPAGRAACVAYRAARRADERDHVAWMKARDAILALSAIGEEAAGKEATRAISYASRMHPAWLWNGVGERGD
jgi:hypothetical protein